MQIQATMPVITSRWFFALAIFMQGEGTAGVSLYSAEKVWMKVDKSAE